MGNKQPTVEEINEAVQATFSRQNSAQPELEPPVIEIPKAESVSTLQLGESATWARTDFPKDGLIAMQSVAAFGYKILCEEIAVWNIRYGTNFSVENQDIVTDFFYDIFSENTKLFLRVFCT